MKRIIVLICIALIFTGCHSKNANNNSNLKFPKTGSYFCPNENYEGTYTLNEDIFEANEKCELYKSDFWQETAPRAYNDCLERKKTFVERFTQGTCSPIVKKTYNIGKSGCIFELATEYDKIIKYSCFGTEIPRVVEEIKAKYEIQELN